MTCRPSSWLLQVRMDRAPGGEFADHPRDWRRGAARIDHFAARARSARPNHQRCRAKVYTTGVDLEDELRGGTTFLRESVGDRDQPTATKPVLRLDTLALIGPAASRTLLHR